MGGRAINLRPHQIAAKDAILARLDGEPVRWYVMLRNATHQRVADATDRDGWMLLWDSPDAAMDWLKEQLPDLMTATHGRKPENRARQETQEEAL